jgi:hypothetical protein
VRAASLVVSARGGQSGAVADYGTSERWLQELEALRTSLGPARPMRMRWRVMRRPFGTYPLITLLSRSFRAEVERDRAELLLFEPSPRKGDRPAAVVPVQASIVLSDADQGALVSVSGNPTPGHAVAVAIRDRVIFCAGPVRQQSLADRIRWPGSIAKSRK